MTSSYYPGSLPAGSGFPATALKINEIFNAQVTGGGIVRYKFSSELPLGTHIYVQDVDVSEVATLQFFDCTTNALVNPSAFDYLIVSTTQTPTAVFSTTDVTLTPSGGGGANEPLVAVIIRSPNICRVEYKGTIPGGSWELFFSVPPADRSITKTSANPFIAGSTGSWTVTLSNNLVASGVAGLSNPTSIYGLSMADTVNASLTGVTATITNAGGTTGGSCTVGGGNVVSCSGFSGLAPGQNIVITISGTVPLNYATQTLSNTATVNAVGPRGNVTGNDSSTVVTAIARAISLTKAWTNGTTGDAVSLIITGGSSTVAGTSTVGGTTTAATAGGTSGATITLAENFTTGAASGYVSSLACIKNTNSSAVAVNGSGLSRTITMPSDSGVTCTWTNVRIVPLVAVKSSTAVSDPINLASNPKAIPGGTVRYCIVVNNPGTLTATIVSVTDPLPALVNYVPGSMKSGATCATATTAEDDDAAGADETDPIGMSISGTTITASNASLAGGGSFAVTFDVLVK